MSQEPVSLRAALLRCQTALFIIYRERGYSIEEAKSVFEIAIAREALDAAEAQENPLTLDEERELFRLREAIKGPDGFATWQEAATAERVRRVKAERELFKIPDDQLLHGMALAFFYAVSDGDVSLDQVKEIKKGLRAALAAAPEAPAQGDARKDRMQKVRDFIQADADLARGIASTEAPAQTSVPAPWREAMKVAREALIDAKTFVGAWPAGTAALAQLDALEGGE